MSVTINNEVTGLAWPKKAQCSGYEKRLIDCPALSEQQFQKCTNLGYAGVKCVNQAGTVHCILIHIINTVQLKKFSGYFNRFTKTINVGNLVPSGQT